MADDSVDYVFIGAAGSKKVGKCVPERMKILLGVGSIGNTAQFPIPIVAFGKRAEFAAIVSLVIRKKPGFVTTPCLVEISLKAELKEHGVEWDLTVAGVCLELLVVETIE